MTQTFKPSDWTTVIPKQRGRMFSSPYLEPVSIVARETGGDLDECLGCGQMREQVVAVVIDHEHHGTADLCSDCRQEHGL